MDKLLRFSTRRVRVNVRNPNAAVWQYTLELWDRNGELWFTQHRGAMPRDRFLFGSFVVGDMSVANAVFAEFKAESRVAAKSQREQLRRNLDALFASIG